MGGLFFTFVVVGDLKTMQTNFFKYPRELAVQWILLTYALQNVAISCYCLDCLISLSM